MWESWCYRRYSERTMRWRVRVPFPAVVRNISFLRNVQTGSGAHPSFYSMGPIFFYNLKWTGPKSGTYLRIVPWLRLGGTVPPHPLCGGADKSLARPGRKQAIFPASYGTWRFVTTFTTVHHLSLTEPNQSISLPITLLTGAACFLPGRAKDLSAPLYYFVARRGATLYFSFISLLAPELFFFKF